MAYSLENTADLTNLADAVRAKTGYSGALTVEDMGDIISGLSGMAISGTQLKRIHWDRTSSITIGKNSSRSFTVSALNKNKKYPFVFFTNVFQSNTSGAGVQSVFVIYDGTQYYWTYSYPYINFTGSVVFNNNNAVITLYNNTNTPYDMRLTYNHNPSSSEEYAELFYFCPVETS